jgi:hypothetical protein
VANGIDESQLTEQEKRERNARNNAQNLRNAAEVAIASKEEVKGFNKFLERYKAAVPVEAKAVECVKGQHN